MATGYHELALNTIELGYIERISNPHRSRSGRSYIDNQARGIFILYTYTYDQFTAFFYGDRVFLGEKSLPTGQCSVDILDLDKEILMKTYRWVQDFLPAAQRLLTGKANITVVSTQEKLNTVWDVVFTLSRYRDLQIDRECNYHALENLLTESDKWMQIRTPGTKRYTVYQEFMEGLSSLTARIRVFQDQIAIMTESYSEPLTRRNSAAYADAYSKFHSQMASITTHYFNENFNQGFPVEVSFVPMMHPTEKGKVFVARKIMFNDLLSLLWAEFYRGLTIGNAPRRCHNCGRYSLLTVGYNACYCNNIAPGETKCICRRVGAHRKEAQGKANHTLAQAEYDHTHNRLKQKKNRKKISIDEWNIAVTETQKLMEQAGRGELTDTELKRQLELFR